MPVHIPRGVARPTAAGQRGTPELVGEPGGVVAAAAEVLVRYSDNGWVALLEQHVDDGSGHCAACWGPVWPCLLSIIAGHAQLLAQRQRGPEHRP